MSQSNQTSSEVRRIFSSIKQYYENHIHSKYVDGYKNYLLYTADRANEIKDFQTNVKIPMTKMNVDTMYTSIFDNDFKFRVSGRNKDDHKKAQNQLNYLEWWFSVSKSRPELMMSLKETLTVGNGYSKIAFVDNTETVEYFKGAEKKTIKMREQYPSLKYVSAFNIYHDPSAKSIDDSKFVIERNILTRKEIVNRFKKMIPNIEEITMRTEPDKNGKSKVSPYYLYSYDFNRVKYLAFWNDQVVRGPAFNAIDSTNTHWDFDFNLYYKNFLTVNYSGGYHEVVEYWEDNKFILLIDWHEAYNDKNPLPIKTKPYVGYVYNQIPGLSLGMGIATDLVDLQEIMDTIFNLFIDNMKMQVAPMFQKIRGSDVFQDGSSTLEYSPFEMVETNTPNAITRLELGTPDFSGLNLIDQLFRIAEMAEGANSYAVGYQDKIERSATGVSARLQSFKARLLPFVDSLNQWLSKICEVWSVLGVVYLDEEIELKVKDKDDNVKFIDISVEDLIGKFDVEFDAQALKTATRETRRKQLWELLQNASTFGVDPITGNPFVDMRKLWKEYLDSFEMASADIILEEKQIYSKRNKSERDKTKFEGNAWIPWLGVASMDGVATTQDSSDGIEQLLGGDRTPIIEGNPESEMIKEAMQL